MEPLFWVNCMGVDLAAEEYSTTVPAGKLRRLLAQCRMMVQQFSTSTTAALLRLLCLQWRLHFGKNWHLLAWLQRRWIKWLRPSRQTSQGKSWHQRQLPRFAYCRWFITTWNRARPSSTSPGKFGCPRSSTRTWRWPRPTNQSGQRHNSLELCWMRPRRFPWRTWNCPQNGWWRPNKFFAMPGSWLEQLTFRSSKSLTTSSSA